MERTKLYAAEQEARARTERAAERMQRLYAVTSGLARAITPNDVADTLLAEGRAALGASLGVLCMLRIDGETLEVVKMAGDNGAVDDRYRVFPLTAPFPIAECVRLREPIAIGSRTEFHERYPAVREATDRSPQQAWLSIPLFVDERAVGSIGFGFPTAREFTEEDMGLAVALAQQCAQALERARLYQAEREARAAAEEAQRRAEEARRKADAERLARELAATARQRALAEYINLIRQKVRSNWILPPDLQGNPQAVFEVIQLPTGEVLSVRLKKSSGNVAYDTAVERAILKSSPLPLPTNRNDFSRTLELTFRPRD